MVGFSHVALGSRARDHAVKICGALLVSLVMSAQQPVIMTLAGVGDRGYSGDSGLARQALLALANTRNQCDPNTFEQISHIAVDAAGAVYFSDTANQRIRRVGPDGVITTVAGNGLTPEVDGLTCVVRAGGAAIGDNGPAPQARFYFPSGLAFDTRGNLIIADQSSNRIRAVTSGIINTIAGNGLHSFYAPNIPATSSGMDWPTAIAIARDGTIYFTELHSGRVARIAADGRLVTVAGTGIPGFNAESGTATLVRLSLPTGIALDSAGNLYIADQGNNRVRKVTPDGNLTTIAAAQQGLDRPADVKVDSRGNIYIADMNNHRVRRINPAGVIETVAGDGTPGRGLDGIPPTMSSLRQPTGLAIDSRDDLYIVDWGNFLIRKVSFSGQPAVTTGGIVNAASYAPEIAPGSLFSIFGMNLAPDPAQVAVRVGGQPARVIFASPGQINAQAPYGVAPGSAPVTITTSGGTSPPEFANVREAAPGIFVAVSPVERGGVLVVYLTGIGAVTPPLGDGEFAPLDGRLHYAALPIRAIVGGGEAPLDFIGLAPGFIGLAQANIRIPANAPIGDDVTVEFHFGDYRSNAARVAIR